MKVNESFKWPTNKENKSGEQQLLRAKTRVRVIEERKRKLLNFVIKL